MTSLKNKIDFAAIITVKHANPNGDPLDNNRPRTNSAGIGEISDVCIKRKIRNRLLEAGHSIFVQSDSNKIDEFSSLRERAESVMKKSGFQDEKEFAEIACGTWLDVRSFGQLFAFKSGAKKKKGEEDDDGSSGVSIGIRGPVSLHAAYSVDPVNITETKITKSVNGETSEKKGSDTFGSEYKVDFGLYVLYGSINPQLAEKTGFNEKDAEAIKKALQELFVNDASAARPDGSMEVRKLYWWQHNSKNGQYSSAKVHRSLHVVRKPDVDEPTSFEDYTCSVDPISDLKLEIIEDM